MRIRASDRRWRIVLILVLSWLLVACPDTTIDQPTDLDPSDAEAPEAGTPPSPPEDPDDPGDAARAVERALFDMVNDERAERGLDALEWDDQLAELAREWSEQMSQDGELRHDDGERMVERAEGFVGVGENIFQSTAAVPASFLHRGWMESDGHRRNLLEESWTRLGVGVVCAPDGQVWATQRFGQPIGSDAPDPDDEVPPPEPLVTPEATGPSCPGDS